MDILLQNISSYEIRSIIPVLAVCDDHTYKRIDIKDLKRENVDHIPIAIGSVEFVRKQMMLYDIPEPVVETYPKILGQEFYKRKIIECKKKDLLHLFDINTELFIKPKNVKKFTGFTLKKISNIYTSINEFSFNINTDQDNLWDFYLTDQDEIIYVSEVVDIVTEWRYYIQDNKVLGYARYDDTRNDNYSEPDISLVEDAISKLDKSHPYVLDFGILKDNSTIFIEYNDFWAIGLYSPAINGKQYLECLIQRWKSICDS